MLDPSLIQENTKNKLYWIYKNYLGREIRYKINKDLLVWYFNKID